MELYQLAAHEIHQLLQKKEVTSEEVTRAVISRIEEVEPKINGYIETNFDLALDMAREVDNRIGCGEEIRPLTGLPVAIKDNMCLRGIPTTCGSNILAPFKPPYEATVVERLRQEGVVFIGKANMDEFAMGSSTETSFFGPTKNPWDLSAIPGGSSGGSAAVVAADEAIIVLGSDTGGSIRQPSALCGVVGLKPTYGRVSRYGLVAFASSLDQIGPITKDVYDAALTMNVIAGFDPQDSTSLNYPVPDYTKALMPDLSGMKLAWPKEYFGEGIEKGVKEKIEEACQVIKSLGAEIEEVSLPHTDYAVATYYLIATAEASSNLARYDGVKYGYRAGGDNNLADMYRLTRKKGFGPEVKRRIMLGTYCLSSGYYDAYYLKAQKVRTLIKADFEEVFNRFDLVITPTSPTVAFKLGEKLDDPLQMYLSDIFTISANLAGIPAISIPCGFVEDLPVGLQMLAPPLGEEKLLQAAYAYEQQTDFHRKKPIGISQ
ncbi:MAG: Asp-tRNA(Asn)/Glu-tRNA(Gln) amidotransferase subunit GatA [bacterium]